MAADTSLGPLRADALRRVPDPPPIEELLEAAGRQRLAAYYLYAALLAGVMRDDDPAPDHWPPQLAEPMQRLGLAALAPRTLGGLDAQLTPAEQATRQSSDRELRFARLLVNLINQGAFGPLCGRADDVRLARPSEGRDLNLELLRGESVVRTFAVKDHWELVAQYLAGAALGGPSAAAPAAPGSEQGVSWLKTSGVGHAVSLGTTLAVHLHPLGAAAGLGTKLVETRIQAGEIQADALGRLGEELRLLNAQAARQIADLRTDKRP
jgi:hypothetical protein